jgi:hypothetical protein
MFHIFSLFRRMSWFSQCLLVQMAIPLPIRRGWCVVGKVMHSSPLEFMNCLPVIYACMRVCVREREKEIFFFFF